jgi:hypothetical protein
MRSQFVRRPDFPDKVVCRGVPSLDGETVHMRAPTEEGEPPGADFVVSVMDFVWVNMPVINADVPDEVRAMFENYGLALVACKIVERQPGFVVLEVPALSGSSRITVKPGNIARPR